LKYKRPFDWEGNQEKYGKRKIAPAGFEICQETIERVCDFYFSISVKLQSL